MYTFGGLGVRQNLLNDMWTMSRQCRGRISLTASRTTFSSGEGPYLHDSVCEWHLAPLLPNRQVRLYFSRFALEQGADYVTVYDGADTSAPLLARLSGHSLPASLVSTSGALLVRLESDSANAYAGFEATYMAECAAGHSPASANPSSADHCVPCAPGHYAPTPGLASCSRCPLSTYADASGAVACLPCPHASATRFIGAEAADRCVCLEGFHAPNGTLTPAARCEPCPVGATCPADVSAALARFGFCRASPSLMAPCCTASDCPGGSGGVPCPADGGGIGEPGTASCEELRLLSMRLVVFGGSLGTVLGVGLACLCLGLARGRRTGARDALRDYARKLNVLSTAPQIGSYTSALAADTALAADLTEPSRATASYRLSAAAMPPLPEHRSCRGAEFLAAYKAPSPSAGSRPSGSGGCSYGPGTHGAGACGGRGGGRREVGMELVDLEDVHAEEAHLVPPSPASVAPGVLPPADGDGGSGGGSGAGGGVPIMCLGALQSAESALMPPSTAAGRSERSADPSERADLIGHPAPPTPPRPRPEADPGGAYVGTCLVQMPDADGRWQPVQFSASMAGSPHGSRAPSIIAPSESTMTMRSDYRSVRRGGAASVGARSDEGG